MDRVFLFTTMDSLDATFLYGGQELKFNYAFTKDVPVELEPRKMFLDYRLPKDKIPGAKPGDQPGNEIWKHFEPQEIATYLVRKYREQGLIQIAGSTPTDEEKALSVANLKAGYEAAMKRYNNRAIERERSNLKVPTLTAFEELAFEKTGRTPAVGVASANPIPAASSDPEVKELLKKLTELLIAKETQKAGFKTLSAHSRERKEEADT